MIAPEEIRQLDDEHGRECTFGCNVRWWSACRSRSASRVNTDARAQTRMCIQLFLSLFLSLSPCVYWFAHIYAYVHVHTLHHVRTHVCAPRCMPEDCLPSADSQMIASDRTLLGASDDEQSATRSKQSVAGSSAETVIQ